MRGQKIFFPQIHIFIKFFPLSGSSAKRTQELVDLHDAHAESARRWDGGRGQAEVMLLNTRRAAIRTLDKDELEREVRACTSYATHADVR